VGVCPQAGEEPPDCRERQSSVSPLRGTAVDAHRPVTHAEAHLSLLPMTDWNNEALGLSHPGKSF